MKRGFDPFRVQWSLLSPLVTAGSYGAFWILWFLIRVSFVI